MRPNKISVGYCCQCSQWICCLSVQGQQSAKRDWVSVLLQHKIRLVRPDTNTKQADLVSKLLCRRSSENKLNILFYTLPIIIHLIAHSALPCRAPSAELEHDLLLSFPLIFFPLCLRLSWLLIPLASNVKSSVGIGLLSVPVPTVWHRAAPIILWSDCCGSHPWHCWKFLIERSLALLLHRLFPMVMQGARRIKSGWRLNPRRALAPGRRRCRCQRRELLIALELLSKR